MTIFGKFCKKDAKTLHKKALIDEFSQLCELISASNSCFNEVTNPLLAKAVILNTASLEARRSLVLKELRELEN